MPPRRTSTDDGATSALAGDTVVGAEVAAATERERLAETRRSNAEANVTRGAEAVAALEAAHDAARRDAEEAVKELHQTREALNGAQHEVGRMRAALKELEKAAASQALLLCQEMAQNQGQLPTEKLEALSHGEVSDIAAAVRTELGRLRDEVTRLAGELEDVIPNPNPNPNPNSNWRTSLTAAMRQRWRDWRSWRCCCSHMPTRGRPSWLPSTTMLPHDREKPKVPR